MNIFHLHKVPKVCAEYHCDKHVVKMILETAQMLSTAYQRHCGLDECLYKPAYPKHPMTIWVGDSIENFTTKTGIKSMVDTVSKGLNIPCGCEGRRKAMNALFPYSRGNKK